MPMLQEVLDAFLKVDRARTTQKHYRRVLSRLVADLGGQTDITLVDLPRLLAYTEPFQRLRPATYLQYVLVIKSFFSFARRAYRLAYNPAAELTVRTPPRDPADYPAIPKSHIDQMRRVAFANPRDSAIICFLADTGARVGGVASLRLPNLHLKEGYAALLEKGEVYQYVDFWGETVAALERWLAVRPQVAHDSVWTRSGDHRPLTAIGITQMIRRVSLAACGVVHTPHEFRRGVARDWEEAGETTDTIKFKLNHKNARTTQLYLLNRSSHLRETSRRLSVSRLRPLDEPPEPPNIIHLDDAG